MLEEQEDKCNMRTKLHLKEQVALALGQNLVDRMRVARLQRSEVERANSLFGQDCAQQRGGMSAILEGAFDGSSDNPCAFFLRL